jgi:RNA polymerase sigma-70 factor, ECF subfamily
VADRSSVFRELYEQHAADVYRFALWLGADRPDAEDITSETFARALASNAPMRTETVKAYLFTIARRYYLELRRRARPHIALSDSLRDSRPGPDAQVEQASETAATAGALGRLTADDRAILVMRAVHDLSYEEIARTLGISVVAVKVRLHRARKRLSASSPQERDL